MSFASVEFYGLLSMSYTTLLKWFNSISEKIELQITVNFSYFHVLTICLTSFIIFGVKKLQDELERTGNKLKQHEENLKFLKTQKNQLDEAILDLQGILIFHIVSYFKLNWFRKQWILRKKYANFVIALCDLGTYKYSETKRL